jgi:hypothetical protein
VLATIGSAAPSLPPAPAIPGRPAPRAIPPPRGPISDALLSSLASRRPLPGPPALPRGDHDLLSDDDIQLSLYCIHELSYRGFDEVDPDAESDLGVHAWRLALEAAFEHALRERTRAVVRQWGRDPLGYLRHVSADDGRSLSAELLAEPDVARFREVLVHRSGYQLKEADPHSWALPRADGLVKAALVEIQMDEYGAGQPGRSHAELFAVTLRAADLDPRYGAYLDRLPGVTLATTNLISLFGRRRRHLPALLGHLALFEMTSVGPMARWSALCDRVGLHPYARVFYDVHVGAHLHDHPEDGPAVVFGAAALTVVEATLAEHLRTSWAAGVSSLLDPWTDG